MNKEKLRASLTKVTREGYLLIWAAGFGSDGSDLKGLSSNLERPFLIGRRRAVCACGGGGTHRRRAPATGDRRRVTFLGFPGSDRPGIWSWRLPVACVRHWSGRQGAAGFVAGCSAVGAARCGGASPASSASAPRERPRPKHLAQKEKGRAWSSHRSLKRQGRDVGRVGGEIRRGRWTEVAVRAVLGYSGLLGRTDRREMALRSRARG